MIENEARGSASRRALHDDVCAFGTFLMRYGLRGKNVAVMGGGGREWAVSCLSVAGGVGAVVPLREGWDLHELKLYANATDCECIVFPEARRDVVWELYNDGVTLLRTFICMGDGGGDPFISMEEALREGGECVAHGDRDFLDAQAGHDELAVIQFTPDAGAPKPVTLTHGNLEALLAALTAVVDAGEDELFLSTLPMCRPLRDLCGLLLSLSEGSPLCCRNAERIERIGRRIIALNPGSGNLSGFAGRALPGTEAAIADADPGQAGEIIFKGPAVTSGYYNKPDHAAPPHPAAAPGEWYHTGHRGTMDESGRIHVLGAV